MKKIVYFILTLFILTSCSKTGDNVKENKKMQMEEKVMNFQEITGQEVESKLKDENFVIVDVRTLGEYNGGHIEETIPVPMDAVILSLLIEIGRCSTLRAITLWIPSRTLSIPAFQI